MVITLNGQTITDYCGKFTYSGSLEQVARVLTIPILKNDKFIPAIGSELVVKDGAEEVFYGFVWSLSAGADSSVNTVTAMSPLIYLSKNIASNTVFNNAPVKTVLETMCNEAGIPFDGQLDVNNKVTINARGKSIYEVMRAGLDELTKQTGRLYHIEFVKRKIHVMTGGAVASNVIAYNDGLAVGTIITKNYEESLDSMVSKVLISGKDGGIKKAISSENEKKYGSISVLADGSTTEAEARKLLKSPTVSIKVGIIADFSYLSGRAVELKSGNAKEHFLIVADTHNYSGSVHTADLVLERWKEWQTGLKNWQNW